MTGVDSGRISVEEAGSSADYIVLGSACCVIRLTLMFASKRFQIRSLTTRSLSFDDVTQLHEKLGLNLRNELFRDGRWTGY